MFANFIMLWFVCFSLLSPSPADDVFLARLFDLDDDRDDKQNDNQATGYTNDSEVSVIQRVQDTGFPLL